MNPSGRTAAGNDDMPQITVLMTVFNTAPYLAEAIESILAQETDRSWELVIVDDGSTDDSLSIARRYALKNSRRICVLQHDGGGNRGISASRNLALSRARGPLTAFLDSDDVWLPHHLETLAGMMAQTPEAGMVYGEAERWIHFARPFEERAARNAWWGNNYIPPLVPAGQAPGLLRQGTLLQWFLHDESLVPCICALMVRTQAARAVGGFENQFRGLYDDQAFHAKISLRYPVFAVEICVARYRQHRGSCCALGGGETSIRVAERARFLAFLEGFGDPSGTMQPGTEDGVLTV